MKAMILAAGLGTRLRPITNDIPKCMVPLNGKPFLEWSLKWLRQYGVTDCVINLHYFPERVTDYFGNGSKVGVRISYSFEEDLLGTSGAVKKVENFFHEPFYVIYGDNFSNTDLSQLQLKHSQENGLGVVGLHWREDVLSSGIVEMDDQGRILRLLEKPKPEEVFSHYVSAGFFFLDPKVFKFIPNGVSDFAYDVFPKIIESQERLYGHVLDGIVMGIDTPQAYQRLQEIITNL